MKIEILSADELALLQQIIKESQNIIITCHKSPDGDALGASLAWSEYLQQLGKKPTIIIPDAFPDFLQWLSGTEKIIRYDKHTEQAKEMLSHTDLIFCLDFNAYSRVDDMSESLQHSPAKLVMIDHHLNPTLPTVLDISHPLKSSTCELVFRIIWQMEGFDQMTARCAADIYCGMMTDTGGFTYNSNDPTIFFIISQLLTKSIDKDKIYRNVFNNYSTWAIRLRGYILCHKLNVINDFHASYFSLSRRDMKDFHFVKGDAEGLVNEPLKIKGMKLSVSLREDDRRDNLVWVSLRSVDNFPCNEMAASFFNGGGHLNASGGHLNCSLKEAEEHVRNAINSYAEKLQ